MPEVRKRAILKLLNNDNKTKPGSPFVIVSL